MIVEFFNITTDVRRQEGPFERVHLEGCAIFGVIGEDRKYLASVG